MTPMLTESLPVRPDQNVNPLSSVRICCHHPPLTRTHHPFFISVAQFFITVTMAASPVALATHKAPEGIDLYSRFALAGALGCSVTHGAFTPVDVSVCPFSSRQKKKDHLLTP